MPLTQVCSCFERCWGFPTTFSLLLSLDRENSSGGETAASPMASISTHPFDILGRMHVQFLGELPLTERCAFHAYVGVWSRDWILAIRRPAYLAAYFAAYAERPAEQPTFGHQQVRANRAVPALRATPKQARPDTAG